MAKLEQIARDLAAVLSPGGEADWRQYLDLARAVEQSSDQQFDEVFKPRPDPREEATGDCGQQPDG